MLVGAGFGRPSHRRRLVQEIAYNVLDMIMTRVGMTETGRSATRTGATPTACRRETWTVSPLEPLACIRQTLLRGCLRYKKYSTENIRPGVFLQASSVLFPNRRTR